MERKNQEKIIKILKTTLQKEKEVLFCYLFGSFANQNSILKSDIDIAVYLDKEKCSDFFEKRLELISQTSKALKKETDVIILNTASPFLKYVILKEGKLILEKNKEQRINFELKTINEYFDFKPILEKYHQKLLAS